MATTDTVEASGLPEDNQPKDPNRTGRYVAYLVAFAFGAGWLTIIGALMWALSKTENTKKTGKGMFFWSLVPLAVLVIAALALAGGSSSSSSSSGGNDFATPLVSTTVAANSVASTSTILTAAPDASVDTAGTCSVPPPSGTDARSIIQSLLDARSTGFHTRNQACFEQAWGVGDDHVARDMGLAANPDSIATIIDYNGPSVATGTTSANVSIQTSTNIAYAVVTIQQDSSGWHMVSYTKQ